MRATHSHIQIWVCKYQTPVKTLRSFIFLLLHTSTVLILTATHIKRDSVKTFFFFFTVLEPHMGTFILTILQYITFFADYMVELQLFPQLLIHLTCVCSQASPSLLISCICWPNPLLLMHPYLRLLPSFSVPAYICFNCWWSSCWNLQSLICCCPAAY